MLSRQLLYTALSRPKKYCWVVGDRAGVARSVENMTPHKRRTRLGELLKSEPSDFDHSTDHSYETPREAAGVAK